ncbi:MAG: CheR family methyltransferase [Phycisphaerae bacterium]
MEITIKETKLSDAEFNQISKLVKSLAGINLHEGKKELVKARLSKRMRQLGLKSFQEYIDYVAEKQDAEITTMLDILSTNLTYFFREPQHLEHLREEVIPEVTKTNTRRLRIWSAGCSSGEEPYSIAMILNEAIPTLGQWDAAILATDLSTRVLQTASMGIYREERFRELPRHLISKYFDQVQAKPERVFKAGNKLRKLIHFARLNLMEAWPMKGPFDVIFCRNVMIYFDKPTQERLVNRYLDLLKPGGLLFLGHSESLTGINHKFRYVKPATYRKP